MPLPLVPIFIGLSAGITAGLAYVKNTKPRGMTPERQKIYEAALINLKDPVKLNELADAFSGEGCVSEAEVLRKRAALRTLPEEEKRKNRMRFKEGMSSKNPAFVEQVAREHEERGASSAAYNLRQYAKGLMKH